MKHVRPAFSDTRLWIASFGIATLLGLAMAAQTWMSAPVRNRPTSFWQPQFLEPQLIPWWMWAVFTPLLVVIIQNVHQHSRPLWRTIALYAALGAATIVVQAVATGFALGWWWSFPSLIPTDPEWHIAHQLRSRTVFGVFVFALIAVGFRRASASPLPAPTSQPPIRLRVPPAPIAIRTKERVVLVKPEQILWVEADRDHVVVHVGDAVHRVRESITSFEARLPADQLVRVSRSAIVNIAAVVELEPWFKGNFMIKLRDGTRIPTGSKYRDRITRLL